MSELPPPRVRGQRPSTCKVEGCGEPIRFYPRPVSSGEPLATSGPEPGNWVHLVPAAALAGHEAVPQDEDA